MSDKHLLLMVGLPRSGKSTKAGELSVQFNAPIVNPDSIRVALHGQRFAPQAEPFVWPIARLMVRALFYAGHEVVIVDATNATRKRRDEWQSAEWKRSFVTIETPKEVCLERAAAEGDTEIVPVIERMAATWEPVAPEESLS